MRILQRLVGRGRRDVQGQQATEALKQVASEADDLNKALTGVKERAEERGLHPLAMLAHEIRASEFHRQIRDGKE